MRKNKVKTWVKPSFVDNGPSEDGSEMPNLITTQEYWLANAACFYGWHFPVEAIDRAPLLDSLQATLALYPTFAGRLIPAHSHALQLTTLDSPGALFVEQTTSRHTTATWKAAMKRFGARHIAFVTPPLFEVRCGWWVVGISPSSPSLLEHMHTQPIRTRHVARGKAPLFIAKLVHLADDTSLLLLSYSHAVRGTARCSLCVVHCVCVYVVVCV